MTHAASPQHDPFHTTIWTTLRGAATDEADAERDACWENLVVRYRPAIETVVRRLAVQYLPRSGPRPSLPELTDGFFSFLFEARALRRADPEQGRFRAYLQGVLRNYLRSIARKKCGPQCVDAPEYPSLVPAPPEDSDLELEEERAWALALLRTALAKLRIRAPKEADAFERVHRIDPDRVEADVEEPRPLADVAQDLGLSRAAVSVRLHRARELLRSFVRFQIAETTWGDAVYRDESERLEAHLRVRCPSFLPEPGTSDG